MIVDQFNTTLSGGAAVAAKRLHHALLESGISSRLFYLQQKQRQTVQDESYLPAHSAWSSRGLTPRMWSRKQLQRLKFKHALRGRPPGLEMFSCPEVLPHTQIDVANLGTDIIQLHWVAKLIDYASFFASIPSNFPIVWTLHDMNPFTGGCHYSGNCTAYYDECQNCPQLGRQRSNDLSWQFFNQKLTAIKGKNIHIVAPSHWLENEARKSRIFANAQSFQTIHNGLDTDIFKPYDKKLARHTLGIQKEGLIIGFGAESLENHRKGFQELLKALPQLATTQCVTGLAFGVGTIDESLPGIPDIVTTGYVNDPKKQALIYSAADIFVMPSLEDNLPQTGLEALACGTPVVAFETGGVPDYVHHHKTGLLAKTGDTTHLAHQIDYLADRPQERRRMAENGRALVINEFHHRHQAAKYISLYRNLLAAKFNNSLHAA